MRIWKSLKWINLHGTACAVLALIVLFGAAVHAIAVATITLLSGIPLSTLPPRLARNVIGIQFFNDNWWFALSYLLLFFGTLIYMEVRCAPRWAVWVTFALLSLPFIGYLLSCVRVGACSGFVMGPIHGP